MENQWTVEYPEGVEEIADVSKIDEMGVINKMRGYSIKNQWRNDEDLMKNYWRIDEELMKNWWRVNEKSVKNWLMNQWGIGGESKKDRWWINHRVHEESIVESVKKRL